MRAGRFVIFARLTRLHTASMEGAAFPLAAYLGGAPLWTLPLISLLGILAHAGGNGMNGLTDVAYDKVDPSKKDHPLVNGDISYRTAIVAVGACIAGALAILLYLVASRGTWLALLLFSGYVVMGATYNLYTKRNKILGITSFALTFSLAFFSMAELWHPTLSSVVIAGAFYTAFYSAFMVGIAGEIKDIRQMNEPNLLRDLGWREGGLWGGPGFFLAWGIMAFQAFALQAMAQAVWNQLWGQIVWFVSAVILGSYTILVMSTSATHARQLKVIGAGSAAGYILIVLAVSPFLGLWLSLVFAILPALFFAGMNRLIWPTSGSAWAPGV